MFEFIKKLFQSEEIEVKSVSFDKIKDFFNEKAKDITQDLDAAIKGTKEKIELELYRTKNNIEALKKAELRNPNVPMKAKQFLHGNKDAYIKAVNLLIEKIESNINNLQSLSQNFDLDKFAKSTSKAYQVLQEFHANESRDIAINIKNLESNIKSIKKSAEERKLDQIKELREMIVSSESKKNDKAALKKERSEKTAEKHETIAKIENLNRLISDLKESNEYQEYLSLVALRKKSINELDRLKDSVLQSFSIINTGLRKYERITTKDTMLLEDYIKDPIEALTKDIPLKILDLLEGARKSIINNTIDLKDKKKDKTLQEIEKLTKEFFTKFNQEKSILRNKIKDFELRVKKNNSKNKSEELYQKVEDSEDLLKNIENKIEFLSKEIEKIDLDKLKKEIEKKIRKAFDISVSIH